MRRTATFPWTARTSRPPTSTTLHCVRRATSPVAPNGVFKIGASGFPTETFGSSNYWVDVLFDTTPVDITPPPSASTSPAANATGVALAANVTVTFSETMNPASITTSSIVLQNGAGPPVPAAVAFNPATKTATLDPSDPLAELDRLYGHRARRSRRV